ncbi:AcrB/AcrD/AcrF family protein [Hephaestia sp. CMS5P-6]|nr:AcrB/AcrD/AcrF family protein [Hephaestia mangrovi]
MDSQSGAWSIRRELEVNWLRLTLLAWVMVAIWSVWQDWGHIYWLALGDTDDNMRLMQVRALLHGQGWYDLRQYRLNPPGGFDIHWTRLVDLPIAALILFFRLFTTEFWAERLACGIAPLIPLAITMSALGLAVRRLVSPLAWPLAIAVILIGCPTVMLMYAPERIDLGGWQLAMLSLLAAGLTDPARRRGGVTIGLATALSLSIGLELLPYEAIAGAIVTLRWIADRDAAARMTTYSLTLSGGSALGYAIFASDANRVMRCDALTPVYLTVMVTAGLLLFLLALASPRRWQLRLLLAAIAAAVIGAGFVLLFPQCLGRPEQVSPELAKNWLDNVREAKPIYAQPIKTQIAVGVMPLIGVIGTLLALWRNRNEPRLVAWLSLLALQLASSAMMFWQVRIGSDAQTLAVPGSVALIWILVPMVMGSDRAYVRVLGTVGAVAFATGGFVGMLLPYVPLGKPNARIALVNKANRFCPTLPALQALNRYPAQTVFTFVDLGPRLITVTHHDAVAGPYHRNGDAILDVQHAFQGSPETFRRIAAKHGATLLLICPNMSESTVYRARAPGGFYDQVAHGQTFPWLKPLPLPPNDPLRLFQIEK